MPVRHSGTRGARRGWGGSGRAPQMAPGVGPDYTSQEPLPGPAAALGTGDKTVFLAFIKAVLQGRAFLEPSAPAGVGFGTGWVMAPGPGCRHCPGMRGWRPLEPPEPTQAGCSPSTPISVGPTATAHPALSRAGGPSAPPQPGGGKLWQGPSESRWGLAAIFALWMFLWTSGEL